MLTFWLRPRGEQGGHAVHAPAPGRLEVVEGLSRAGHRAGIGAHELLAPVFGAVARCATAVVEGLGAEGSWIAENNIVSQAVPHLHVHVVPRTRGDGLRGFFWPRQKYEGEEEMIEYATRLRASLS